MKFTMKEKGFAADFEYGTLDISADSDYGFRPFQLMIASIAGCSGSVFKKVLDKKRINFEDIEITVDYQRSGDKVNRIEKIHLSFFVKGKGLDQKQLEKSLELSHKYCSMVQSVKDNIDITVSVQSGE
ncbi:putative OsmC-like protein [Melghiribacillus thermohalophilus]|uniref:Putative OsmC-like protein n=1 Tax=Melghiribacillus thermohalophilus TaxID=1324956 RepID=A0A4R3MW26_9BACI|nr:OsmC family protein [Melghiribacillus thermohalophilus]TCT19641.1 putative OsmC-like protein [Melghiribacillus thermohalophilus]